MTETLTRAEQLRNDIENLCFSRRYYFGVLAELEQLGKTHTKQFKDIRKGITTLNSNIKRMEEELKNMTTADLNISRSDCQGMVLSMIPSYEESNQ